MEAKMCATPFAFFCLLQILSVAVSGRKNCTVQGDCLKTECCAKKAFREEFNCVPYRKYCDTCLAGEFGGMTDGTYDINCPCGPNLICIQTKETQENGEIKYVGLPKCRKFGEDDFTECSPSSSFEHNYI